MRRSSLLFALLLASGCGGKSAEGPITIAATFPAVDAQPEQELLGLCQSYTLHNDQPLYVNAVEMQAGPGWHHSNWFFVPDTMYPGPDGTWDCNSRNFDQFQAGTKGGVLFAQSTQSTGETQQFPPGATIRIPAHSRIAGDIHIVNASTSAIHSAISLTLHAIPADQVTVHLMPMTMTYEPLDLPPHARSRFTASCDVAGNVPMDFRFYYVLPHYHNHGTDLRISTSGGPLGDVNVFENNAPVGQAWGKTFDPPIDSRGQTHITFSCDYNNTTDQPIYFGNMTGEMCMFLAYTDSPSRWLGGVLMNNAVVGTDANGVILNSGNCTFGTF